MGNCDTIAGRMIRIYDEAIVSAALAASITVHEVAHNWHPDFQQLIGTHCPDGGQILTGRIQTRPSTN